MQMLVDHPVVLASVTFLGMWCSAQLGARAFSTMRRLEPDERNDLGFVVGATLTLLGLLIGFSFSMAVGRYDQRKGYEEEEANAIGTEYVRAELLAPADAERLQQLLKTYLQLRIRFYQTPDGAELQQIAGETARVQDKMWSAVKTAAATQPNPLVALAVAGMNDVLNRQGYTQAAWWNRIPTSAWCLIVLIAVFSNVMLGFAARHEKFIGFLILILPIVLSASFLLLADLDSPRGGIIRVRPQNLLSLSTSMHPVG